MSRLLHIVASPRGAASRTLALANLFVDKWKARHPEGVVEEIDLFKESLPELHAETVQGKYVLMGGREIPPELQGRWDAIVAQINRFQSADEILISSPMWNFTVPYKLKHYLDVIMQPRHLYRFTGSGFEGLAKPKRAFVVTSRGGDYSPDGPAAAYDKLDPYLAQALGFIGIADVTFFDAQGMDTGEANMKKGFDAAAGKIADFAL